MSIRDLIDQPTGKDTKGHDSCGPGFRVQVCNKETNGPLSKPFLKGEKMPCFLGLSPETSFSNRERLKVILKWLSQRSNKILVLEGSYFRRWDIMVFHRTRQHEAEQEVLRRVRQFERRLNDVIATLGIENLVESLQWPEILQKTEKIQTQLRSYAKRSASFSTDVDAMLVEFLTRTRPGGRYSLSTGDESLLKNYIFEELSVFLYLSQNGCPLEIYPGSDLEIMQRIAANDYPDFPISCPTRSHVSIQLIKTS
jgi:tRNA-dependent cyclodipeptide synthase